MVSGEDFSPRNQSVVKDGSPSLVPSLAPGSIPSHGHPLLLASQRHWDARVMGTTDAWIYIYNYIYMYKIFNWIYKMYNWIYKMYNWIYKIYNWMYKIYNWTYKMYNWIYKIYNCIYKIYGWQGTRNDVKANTTINAMTSILWDLGVWKNANI